MKTLVTILLAVSALLASTSIAAQLAADPRRMRSEPREDNINGSKKSDHRRRRRRRRNKSIRWAQRSLGSNSSNEGFDVKRRRNTSIVHSNDNLENAMQKEEIVEAKFDTYVPPGENTDTVITMDDTFAMPAEDGFVLLPFQESTIDLEAESGLGLELPPESGHMPMPLDALETAPIIMNGMSMEFVEPQYQSNTEPTLTLEEYATTTTRPAEGEVRVVESTTAATSIVDREAESSTAADTVVSMEFPVMPMEFTELPFSADRENGSTIAATVAASSGETITTTTASKESKILLPSISDATMTNSIEEEEPEDMITIVGEHLSSSSSMNSPIVIATVVVGALFMMW